tara:strand:- start:274 stop:498 length:225 start_codon:yes stop_codon:yes gene_type:complete
VSALKQKNIKIKNSNTIETKTNFAYRCDRVYVTITDPMGKRVCSINIIFYYYENEKMAFFCTTKNDGEKECCWI